MTFFPGLLVHTKGPTPRSAFVLRPWQEHEIIRPLFGEVLWSTEHSRYVRRYRVAHIVVARKNGKSELAAGILLYLLVGDDEEAAEVYSAAKDTKQAGKVFEPALRMTQLSPVLSKRLVHNKNTRRLIDERTASYYEVITADAKGELGHSPHGFCLDEVLSQRDGSLWETMTTATGARAQELLLAVTTETNDPVSFGAELIDEAVRVDADPASAPHVFTFVRRLPRSAGELELLRASRPGDPDLPVSVDVFDEANWKWPNPALDEFLSRDALRRAASEAAVSPEKENGFRQYRANQRVAQASRWMPMHEWDECAGTVWPEPGWGRPALAGRVAWAGFDLAAKLDLTAWCLLLPPAPHDPAVHMLWRFWLPEAAIPRLDRFADGAVARWAAEGWITVTPGNVVDYERMYDDVAADAATFQLVGGHGDVWSAAPVVQALATRAGVPEFVTYRPTFERMTPGMSDLMGMVRDRQLAHHANPVARWCFDAVEALSATYNPDLIRPEKPSRSREGRRIDAVSAAVHAVTAWKESTAQPEEPFVMPRRLY